MPRRHLNRCIYEADLLRANQEGAEVMREVGPLLDSGGIVAMIGNRGTGKTQLAVRLALGVLARGLRVRYTTAIEMFSSITGTYGTGKREIDAVRDYTWPALLIIDEANERRDTKNEDVLLAWIMDQRYREMRGTLLCSNLTRAAFADGVGPSITSRIWEGGQVVEVVGRNWRKEK